MGLVGPARLLASVRDNKDGTYRATYTATLAGWYQLTVQLQPAGSPPPPPGAEYAVALANVVRAFRVQVGAPRLPSFIH